MGTPELARTVLHRLATSDRFDILGVVAQPDRPAGRSLLPQAPPVKVKAEQLGLKVWQPEKAREPEFIDQIRELRPDAIVVAAYGQILVPRLLEVPVHGCVNLHTSLLPRWRGAAPIQWAIASGDSETGVTLMRMEAGLDTGPILAMVRTPIGPHETGDELHERLANLAAELVVERLPEYLLGRIEAVAQPAEGITYARKISRDDGRIDWSLSSTEIDQRRRAFTPWPGAFCQLPIGGQSRMIKIHGAEVVATEIEGADDLRPGWVVAAGPSGILVRCGKGFWRITELQPEGGRRMTAAQFLAGNRPTVFE